MFIFALPTQGLQVRPLVRELRSHMPCGMAKLKIIIIIKYREKKYLKWLQTTVIWIMISKEIYGLVNSIVPMLISVLTNVPWLSKM